MLVDMTTSEPSLAVEIHGRRKDVRRRRRSTRPCRAGDVGARNATLSIMVGGDEDAVERVRPLLETIGQTILRQGGPGAGQHTKMVNQILIATGMIGVCEALLYGYRAGLDLETVLESVASGAAGSWSLTNYGPRMLVRGLRARIHRRPLREGHGHRARRGEADAALATGARARRAALRRAPGAGRRAGKGTHSLMLALASLSDVDWESRG